MRYQHEPVLLEEVVGGLNPQPGQHFADGTVGGGGHARAILERTSPDGRLLAFDLDQAALLAAQQNLKTFGERVTFVHAAYRTLAKQVERLQFPKPSGVLLDLGLSSAQLSDESRGFSYSADSPLDLRFDTSGGRTAADILQHEPAETLARIFRDYGDEPRARALARAIVEARRTHPVCTTGDLLAIVTRVTHGGGRRSFHPATLVWQALRLAVNHELEELPLGLRAALSVLGSGGKLAVISFHSGEDRLVKEFFRTESRDCICSPEVPKCVCGHKAQLTVLTRKPITASAAELKRNSRARSAKLRLAQKI